MQQCQRYFLVEFIVFGQQQALPGGQRHAIEDRRAGVRDVDVAGRHGLHRILEVGGGGLDDGGGRARRAAPAAPAAPAAAPVAAPANVYAGIGPANAEELDSIMAIREHHAFDLELTFAPNSRNAIMQEGRYIAKSWRL